MSPFHLTGRKALVTGGARGLGAGMAVALAAAGGGGVVGGVVGEQGRAKARARAAPRVSEVHAHAPSDDGLGMSRSQRWIWG
jgi:NAD(P)-dependent dehydrogenase (short-subunit alcohol dehydrogenase family)